MYIFGLYLVSIAIKGGDAALKKKRPWIIGVVLLVLTIFILTIKIIIVLVYKQKWVEKSKTRQHLGQIY